MQSYYYNDEVSSVGDGITLDSLCTPIRLNRKLKVHRKYTASFLQALRRAGYYLCQHTREMAGLGGRWRIQW